MNIPFGGHGWLHICRTANFGNGVFEIWYAIRVSGVFNQIHLVASSMTPAILSPNHSKILSLFKKKVEERFWIEIKDSGCGIALFRAGYPSLPGGW